MFGKAQPPETPKVFPKPDFRKALPPKEINVNSEPKLGDLRIIELRTFDPPRYLVEAYVEWQYGYSGSSSPIRRGWRTNRVVGEEGVFLHHDAARAACGDPHSIKSMWRDPAADLEDFGDGAP